jgi:hypothetical protein
VSDVVIVQAGREDVEPGVDTAAAGRNTGRRRLGRSTPASAHRGVSAKVMNKTNVNEELVKLS